MTNPLISAYSHDAVIIHDELRDSRDEQIAKFCKEDDGRSSQQSIMIKRV